MQPTTLYVMHGTAADHLAKEIDTMTTAAETIDYLRNTDDCISAHDHLAETCDRVEEIQLMIEGELSEFRRYHYSDGSIDLGASTDYAMNAHPSERNRAYEITVTQHDLDDLCTYLDDARRENIHGDGHDTPAEYVIAYAKRYGRDELEQCAAMIGVDVAVRLRAILDRASA